ncbi:TPA: ornithine cyclodeaminase family protein [Enterobacter bugandensis]
MQSTGIPVITAEQTAEILRHIDVREAMRRVFMSLAQGQAVQPAQKLVLLPDNRGDFINYFGVDMSRQRLGAKISPYLVKEQTPVITAWTLLMSTVDGMPLALCDASLLTTERTAATTALAVELLAPADAQTLTIIGAGPVARAHIRHALPLRKWKEIRVWSRSNTHSAASIAREAGVPDGILSVCRSAEEAASDTDVLMLCTSSATPVVDIKQLSKPCLITSISTNAPGAHEVSPQALPDMDVYCDYRQTTPDHAGEMVIAAREALWSAESIQGDLPELVSGCAASPLYKRHAFFRSLGLGLEDIAVADCILSYLIEKDN